VPLIEILLITLLCVRSNDQLGSVQGQIIHEAGEAEASGPGPRYGLGLTSTTKIYKVGLGPLWVQNF